MSKNTGASAFRKVDVDDFDPEKFKDEVEGEGECTGPSESEVNTFLAQGKNTDALKVILKDPVLGGNTELKVKTAKLAIQVMTSFKTSEIDAALKSLDQPLLDVLMKYIYRGFEFPGEGSSAALLTWHEKTFALGGSGCIIRVLTDRKRV